MKKTLIFTVAVILIAFTGCKTQKVSVQESEEMVEIKEPFDSKEYRTDDEYIRAVGMAKSQDMAFSKSKSESEAKSKLATSIKTNIERVYSKYANEYSAGKTQDFNDKSQEMILESTNQTLLEVKVLGTKTFKGKDGSYVTYTATEIKKDVVYNGIKSKISSDQKLKTDFQEEQFKKIFDEQMKKIAE